jgi:hypothetical protein
MSTPAAPLPDERIVDTMIELARAAKAHRIIVAGSDAFDAYLALLQRGFARAATTTTARIPCGQFDVALIAGRHTVQALENLLVQIVCFLNARATVAIWVDADQQRGRRIQALLERLGFRVEAGTSCESGFVLAAQRSEWGQAANVA